MSDVKLYPERDPDDLGELYILHVEAMTADGLHSKSDIAVQLAWRDREILRLRAEKADAIREAKAACEELDFDATWPDNLHLADVIEKRLVNLFRDRIRNAKG